MSRSVFSFNAQLCFDSLHALSVGNSKTVLGAAEVQVKLLKSLILSLGNQSPDKYTTTNRKDGKEDVCAILHVVKHVACGQSDHEVEDPVGRSNNRHTAGTDRGGKQFLSQDPGHGTPRVGKVACKEPDEDDRDPSGSFVLRPVSLVGTVDTCDDDMADEHANCTNNKESLATELVEEEHCWECEENLKNTSHTRGKKGDGCRGETEGAENLRCVVKNCIDTRELLEDHDPATDSKTLENVGCEENPNLLPWCKNTTLTNLLLLSLSVEKDGRLDFKIFSVEKRILDSQRGENGRKNMPKKRTQAGTSSVAMGSIEIEFTITGVSNVVRHSSRVTVSTTSKVHSVICPECNGSPNSDGELLQRDQRTTKFRGRNLGLVKRNDHGEHPNTDAANDSASKKIGRTLSTSLDIEYLREILSQSQPLNSAPNQAPSSSEATSHPWMDRSHDTLIITVHHTAKRGEGTGHEDIGVSDHANETACLVHVGLSHKGLAGSRGNADHYGYECRQKRALHIWQMFTTMIPADLTSLNPSQNRHYVQSQVEDSGTPANTAKDCLQVSGILRKKRYRRRKCRINGDLQPQLGVVRNQPENRHITMRSARGESDMALVLFCQILHRNLTHPVKLQQRTTNMPGFACAAHQFGRDPHLNPTI
ncbi:sugar transporter, partial [Aureobasidium melanogenum]